jgi:hypothetical protein
MSMQPFIVQGHDSYIVTQGPTGGPGVVGSLRTRALPACMHDAAPGCHAAPHCSCPSRVGSRSALHCSDLLVSGQRSGIVLLRSCTSC